MLKKLIHNKLGLIGLTLFLMVLLVAIIGPFVVVDQSKDTNEQQPALSLQRPGHTTVMLCPGDDSCIPIQSYQVNNSQLSYLTTLGVEESLVMQHSLDTYIRHRTYLFGTDVYGRSILSRLVNGIYISILVGLFSVLVSLSIGISLGLLAGYYGGVVDKIVMYFVNVMWSIPTLLLVFAIVLALGRGFGVIVLSIGLTMWVDVARIVRGQTMQKKEAMYVKAARVLGIHDVSILFKHILPNIIGPILVVAAANFSAAILIESGLSYLGFGIKPPTPSLGNMLNEHYGYAITGKPFLAIIPAVTIMILVLSINLLGSGLRDVFDVKKTS